MGWGRRDGTQAGGGTRSVGRARVGRRRARDEQAKARRPGAGKSGLARGCVPGAVPACSDGWAQHKAALLTGSDAPTSCAPPRPTSMPNSKNSRCCRRCTGHMAAQTAAAMASASASLRGARPRCASVALSLTAGIGREHAAWVGSHTIARTAVCGQGARAAPTRRTAQAESLALRSMAGTSPAAAHRRNLGTARLSPDDNWSMMVSATSGAAPSTRDTCAAAGGQPARSNAGQHACRSRRRCNGRQSTCPCRQPEAWAWQRASCWAGLRTM